MKIVSNDDDSSKKFIEHHANKSGENAGNTGVTDLFRVAPRGVPKDRCSEGRNRTSLRKLYPSEWSCYKNLRYGRCTAKGGYVLHPDFGTFAKFLALMGPHPGEGYTVDRIDSKNPEYGPGNVRWASKKLQTENRSMTLHVTANGQTLSVPEWSRRTSIPASTIRRRINELHWSHHDAVTVPVGGKREIDCTEYTYAPPNPPPIYHPLLTVFQAALREHHAAPFCVLEPKHLKMVRQIAELIESGGLSATEVFTLVVNNWGDKHYKGFVRFVSGFATMPPPSIPTLEFLRAHVNAAGNFFLREKGQLEYFGVVSASELHAINTPPDFVPVDNVIMLEKYL